MRTNWSKRRFKVTLTRFENMFSSTLVVFVDESEVDLLLDGELPLGVLSHDVPLTFHDREAPVFYVQNQNFKLKKRPKTILKNVLR